MRYGEYTWFVVFLIGATDGWPNAAFLDREEAVKWGVDHTKNEGYLIKSMTLEELAELTDD